MEYSVYVIQSLKTGKRYVGMTKKTPQERLKDHNEQRNRSTKDNTPYVMIYFEKNYCKSCALRREEFLKSGQGRKILDLIENERTHG